MYVYLVCYKFARQPVETVEMCVPGQAVVRYITLHKTTICFKMDFAMVEQCQAFYSCSANRLLTVMPYLMYKHENGIFARMYNKNSPIGAVIA